MANPEQESVSFARFVAGLTAAQHEALFHLLTDVQKDHLAALHRFSTASRLAPTGREPRVHQHWRDHEDGSPGWYIRFVFQRIIFLILGMALALGRMRGGVTEGLEIILTIVIGALIGAFAVYAYGKWLLLRNPQSALAILLLSSDKLIKGTTFISHCPVCARGFPPVDAVARECPTCYSELPPDDPLWGWAPETEPPWQPPESSSEPMQSLTSEKHP